MQTPVKYFLGGRYLLQKWKENISTAKCFFEMFDQNAAGDAAEQEEETISIFDLFVFVSSYLMHF